MLVKFTNSAENLIGMPLWIETNNIMSIFESSRDNGSLITCIYGVSRDTWFVEEGLLEVVKLIKKANENSKSVN